MKQEMKFVNIPRDWTPSTLLSLDANTLLAGGHWGGLYIISRDAAGVNVPTVEFDRRIADPIR